MALIYSLFPIRITEGANDFAVEISAAVQVNLDRLGNYFIPLWWVSIKVSVPAYCTELNSEFSATLYVHGAIETGKTMPPIKFLFGPK